MHVIECVADSQTREPPEQGLFGPSPYEEYRETSLARLALQVAKPGANI
jgi:hypothetical protein